MPQTEVIQGVEELSRKITQMTAEIVNRAMPDALYFGGQALERSVKKSITNKHLILTSNYKDSITTERMKDGNTVVFTNTIYSRIHEFGGTITVRDAPFLVFPIGRGENQVWVRVKSVKMPARPHWRPALVEGQKDILDNIVGTLEKAHAQYAER